MRVFAPLAMFLCAALCALPAAAAALSGKVVLVESGKPAAAEEYADTVVYVVPKTPVPVKPLEGGAEMRMEKKAYTPRVLTVTQGTEVRFPNLDPILHNAFSTSTNNAFDLQLFGGGETKAHRFESAGLVRMYCNVHHQMVGYIVVVDTPYYTTVSPTGEFTLGEVPAEGDLYIWHPRGDALKLPLAGAQPGVEYKVELTQRRIPKHMNKEGKSYRRSREDNY